MDYNICYTADFILKVPGVYTHSMETIYVSLVNTGNWGNFFIKSPVFNGKSKDVGVLEGDPHEF